MRNLIVILSLLIFAVGCARVNVGGTEKPIKVDVTMRVDIYQHVVEQADNIESMVRSDEEAEKPQSFLRFFIAEAYAAEYSAAVESAIESRKSRLDKVNQLLASGVIGENNQGLLEVRKSSGEASSVVSAENKDRMTIYKDLAEQNGVEASAIQEVYAGKMQSLAPKGSPTEDSSGNWSVK